MKQSTCMALLLLSVRGEIARIFHFTYPPIAEGILALHDPTLRALYDLKVGTVTDIE